MHDRDDERNPKLVELNNEFTRAVFGTTARESRESGKCIVCKEPARLFSDLVSQREYLISGLCQRCQDRVFSE